MFARGLSAQIKLGLLLGAMLMSITWCAPTRAPASAVGPQSSAARAWQLAGRLDNARNVRQRTDAVLAIVKALGWPVVGAKRRVVWSGARNMPRGFMVYSFELTGAAKAMTGGNRYSLDGLATVLANGGLVANGQPLSDAVLRRALVSVISKAARTPNATNSFVAMLVRDLGLRRHRGRFDLARRSTPASAMVFDPVQTLILAGDLAIGAAQLRTHAAADRFAASVSPPWAHTASTPCRGLDGLKDALTGGKLGVGIIGAVVSSTVRAVTVTIDGLHGTLMAQLIEAKATTGTSQLTHYGPTGHDPNGGKVLKLGVRVFNYGTPREGVTDCGPLFGVKFPPYGPMKGVGITWGGLTDAGFLRTSLNLGQYGSVSYEPADQQTGSDGIASLVFTPNNEQIPGFGTVLVGVNTSVYADVHYASAIGNYLTAVSTLIIPLEVRYYVKVTAHVPRGFKFGPADYRFIQSAGGQTAMLDFLVKGQVCSQDPWSEPWNIDETLTAPGGSFPASYSLTIPQDGVYSTGSDFVHLWALPAPAGPYPSNPFRLQLTLSPTPSAFNGTVTPSSLQIASDVTEDTSCPFPPVTMWQQLPGGARDN